jgi:hypothetical protein
LTPGIIGSLNGTRFSTSNSAINGARVDLDDCSHPKKEELFPWHRNLALSGYAKVKNASVA